MRTLSTQLTTVLALMSASIVHAQSAPSSVTWYEDGVRQEARLVPGLVAEFGRGASSAGGGRQKLSSGAIVLETPNMRIFKPTVNVQQKTALPLSANQSPVFSTGVGAGPLRALPGGVIVTFKGERSEAAMRAWSEANGLEFEKKLPVTTVSMALLKTAPGLPSLEMANRVRELPDVAEAEPNWWTEKRRSDLWRPPHVKVDPAKAAAGRAESSRRFSGQ